METTAVIIICGIMLSLLVGYVWSVAWVINDAQKRGSTPGYAVFLFFVFGPLAALI